MRISRQFFRLFKVFEEIQHIKNFRNKKYHDEFDRMINIIQYFLYGLYWIFDNVVVICSCKIVRWQTKPIYKVALYIKYLAILQGLLISSRNFMRYHHQEIKIRLNMLELHNEKDNQDAVHKIDEIKQRKISLWLHIFKLGCDLIPAIEWSDVFVKWTKHRIPELWVALAGLISALVTTYQPRLDIDYWEKSLKKF